MYIDHVKAHITINNTSRKHILLNISIIERPLEFKAMLAHRRC